MIKKESVRYLSLEGGGGKGAVYLGALAALAQLGILQETKPGSKDYSIINSDTETSQIVGISGASAGAITAALLASNHTTEELFKFMTSGVLEDFYDPPVNQSNKRMVPDVSSRIGCRESSANIANADALTMGLLAYLSSPVSIVQLKAILLAAKVGKLVPEALANALQSNLTDYVRSFFLDLGLFSGCAAWRVLDNMINKKAYLTLKAKHEELNPDRDVSPTFERFYQIFNRELILTGTNILTRQSIYFSRKNTPGFRVIDAIRISMSFPGAFKPVRISDSEKYGNVPSGVWMDGGILNNNPMHAFDDPATGRFEKNVLALRIEEDQFNSPIKNVYQLFTALAGTIMSASEIGQIRTTDDRSRTINLNEGGLSVLEFSPPYPVLKDAVISAAEKVLNAFNWTEPRQILEGILRNWKMFA